MEDFPIEIPLSGLSQKVNTAGASVSINLRPYDKGLRSILAPRLIYPLTSVWPFPQIFRLGNDIFVAKQDAIYRVSTNSLVPLIQEVPNANYPWDAAYVGDYNIFVNNKVVVVGRDSLDYESGGKVPTGRSICSIAGQIVIAAPWAYGEQHKTSVMWSHIGSVDFTIDRSNIAAIRFADCGDVLKVLPQAIKTIGGIKLGFIAFGTLGVTSFLADSPPAIFSMYRIANVGIYSQLAAAGDFNNQFFVSQDKKLYSIAEGKATDLGYQAQLQGAGSEIVLSYDSANKDLWVSY